MARRKRDPGPVGETFESFLAEQGIRDEVYDHALKAVLAWRLDRQVKPQKASKS